MVADIARRLVRSLGFARSAADSLAIARSGTVAVIRGDTLRVWDPDAHGPGGIAISVPDEPYAGLTLSAGGHTIVASIAANRLRR